MYKRQTMAIPAAVQFVGALDSREMLVEVNKIETQVRNGRTIDQVRQDLKFIIRERQVKNNPFPDEDHLIQYASKIVAYTAFLTMMEFSPNK